MFCERAQSRWDRHASGVEVRFGLDGFQLRNHPLLGRNPADGERAVRVVGPPIEVGEIRGNQSAFKKRRLSANQTAAASSAACNPYVESRVVIPPEVCLRVHWPAWTHPLFY